MDFQVSQSSVSRGLPLWIWRTVSWRSEASTTLSCTSMTQPVKVKWRSRPTWWRLNSTATLAVRWSWWVPSWLRWMKPTAEFKYLITVHRVIVFQANGSEILYKNTIMTPNSTSLGLIHRHDSVHIDFSCYYSQPHDMALSIKLKDRCVFWRSPFHLLENVGHATLFVPWSKEFAKKYIIIQSSLPALSSRRFPLDNGIFLWAWWLTRMLFDMKPSRQTPAFSWTRESGWSSRQRKWMIKCFLWWPSPVGQPISLHRRAVWDMIWSSTGAQWKLPFWCD